MANEVTIHITTADDTAAGRAKTREDFQKLGDDVSGDLDKKLSDGGTKAGKNLSDNVQKGADKVRGQFVTLGQDVETELSDAGTKAGESLGDGVTRGADGRLRDARSRFVTLGEDVDKTLGDAGAKAGKGMGEKSTKAAQQAAQPGGGMMATMIAGGLVAGGPAIGAAMAGIGALGLVALGAKLQAGAPQIQAAWGNLVNDAKVSATAYSSVMVEPIHDALNKIDIDLQKQEPVIQSLFSSAAADIPIFTTGLTNLVDNALPGFDNAMQHSTDIAHGLASLMGQVGSGIGDIGNSVASSSGRIGTDLGSLGNIVHSVGTGIGSLVSISSGLAEGALPALNGAVGLVTGALGGLHSLLGPIEPELGGIASVAGGTYLAFSKLQPAADKLGASMAAKGGLLGSASGLAAGLPYVGAAVVGLSLVTGILAQQNEKAAQAATDEARSSDNLNHALAGVTNATQAQIDGMVEQNAAGQKWLSTAQDTTHQVASLEQILAAAGVTQNQFSSAVEQGGGQLDVVKSKLNGFVDAQNNAYSSGKDLTDFQINQAQGASALAGRMGDLSSAFQGSAAQQELLAVQTAQTSLGMDHASINSSQLAGDLQVLSTATSTTTARTTALTDALKLMANGGAEPANDALAQAWSTVNGLGSALQGTTGRLLSTGGQLDLTTTKGEAANTAFEGLRNQTVAYAQALASQGNNAATVQAKTQALIDQLVGPMAKALGLSQSQVKALADKLFGLNGANIVMTMDLNTNQAYNALDTLIGRIQSAKPVMQVGIGGAAAVQHGVQVPRVAGGPAGLSHYDTGGATGDLTMNEHGGEAVRLPTGSMVIPNSSADGAARTAFEQAGIGGGGGGIVEMRITGNTGFSSFLMNEFRAGRIQLVDGNGKRIKVG